MAPSTTGPSELLAHGLLLRLRGRSPASCWSRACAAADSWLTAPAGHGCPAVTRATPGAHQTRPGGAMEVRLLGPLEVADGGRSIAYGGASPAGSCSPCWCCTPTRWWPASASSWSRARTRPWRGQRPSRRAVLLRRALPEGRLVTRPPGYLFRRCPRRGRCQPVRAAPRPGAPGATRPPPRRSTCWPRLWPCGGAGAGRLPLRAVRSGRDRPAGGAAAGLPGGAVEADPGWAPGPSWSASSSASSASSPCASGSAASLALALYRSGRQADALKGTARRSCCWTSSA